MTDTLFHAYVPLLFWTGLGLVLFRVVPEGLPRLLGRSLYWVGVPIEVFALAHRTDFSGLIWLAPTLTGIALLVGLALAWSTLQGLRYLPLSEPEGLSAFWIKGLAERDHQGSFVLCSMLGNTGFVGLAIAPALISEANLGWAVFYAVTQNVFGTYGLGVFLASYFGRGSDQDQSGWKQCRDILKTPSLWAFGLGILSRSWAFPAAVDSGFKGAIAAVIAGAFLLIGMRLCQLQGLHSLQLGLVPACLKVLVLPLVMGLGSLGLGLPPEPRLALVLMAGMPSAFANLILAEEYNLNRDLTASSIAVSTLAILPLIPLWITLFG
jgi:malate permease and related proteins